MGVRVSASKHVCTSKRVCVRKIKNRHEGLYEPCELCAVTAFVAFVLHARPPYRGDGSGGP
jgi:hypothetical protein